MGHRPPSAVPVSEVVVEATLAAFFSWSQCWREFAFVKPTPTAGPVWKKGSRGKQPWSLASQGTDPLGPPVSLLYDEKESWGKRWEENSPRQNGFPWPHHRFRLAKCLLGDCFQWKAEEYKPLTNIFSFLDHKGNIRSTQSLDPHPHIPVTCSRSQPRPVSAPPASPLCPLQGQTPFDTWRLLAGHWHKDDLTENVDNN